jgi:drug/metabolite transporter (DMT)-like permease
MKTPPADPTKTRPPTWALALAFGVVYVSWGTTYLAIKIGVHDERLPPALFGGTRVCLAGLLVLGALALCGVSLRVSRRDLGSLLVGGAILFVGGNGLINLAETTVPSGAAAVLAATTPLWIALVELFWRGGDRLGLRGWCGLLLGLAGVGLMLGPQLGDPAALLSDVGPLLVLGSAAAWALGSVMMRRRRLGVNHLTAAAYQMVLGGGLLALLGLACGEAGRLPEAPTAAAVGAYVYLLVVGSLLGFLAFNWLLSHVSAAQAGTYAYVNPVVAVLIAWAVGETMTVGIVAGIVIILTGVALVRGSGRRPNAAPLEEVPLGVPLHADTLFSGEREYEYRNPAIQNRT